MQCLAKQWWPCSDEYYHKGTWYTQTFLCQLLRGHNKNQFFYYFGLLHDLLHCQNLLNEWFEKKLKYLIMFLSVFGKRISPGWFFCLSFQGNVGTFRLPINSISCIWIESSVRCFLSAAFTENLKSYRSGTTTSTSHSRKLERSFAEISLLLSLLICFLLTLK